MKGPKVDLPDDIDDQVDDLLAVIRNGEVQHALQDPEEEAERSVSRIWAALKKRLEANSNGQKTLDAQA